MNPIKHRRVIQEARELFAKAQYEEAIKQYEEVIELGMTREDMINLGSAYIEVKRYSQAEYIFKVLAGHEKDARICYSLAFLYQEEGRYEEALAHYEEAIQLEPNHFFLCYDCAFLYDHLQRYDEAKRHYIRALELDPNHFWANLNLGAIYEHENCDQEALQLFLKAYEIDSSQNMIAYNLGTVYAKLNMPEVALKYYLEELTKPEPYNQTYYNLGTLYKTDFRDYEKARLAYLEGINQNPDHYECWYNLGCLYALIHDYDNATACFTYVFYKKHSLIDFMKEDADLVDYLKSPEYDAFINGQNAS